MKLDITIDSEFRRINLEIMRNGPATSGSPWWERDKDYKEIRLFETPKDLKEIYCSVAYFELKECKLSSNAILFGSSEAKVDFGVAFHEAITGLNPNLRPAGRAETDKFVRNFPETVYKGEGGLFILNSAWRSSFALCFQEIVWHDHASRWRGRGLNLVLAGFPMRGRFVIVRLIGPVS